MDDWEKQSKNCRFFLKRVYFQTFFYLSDLQKSVFGLTLRYKMIRENVAIDQKIKDEAPYKYFPLVSSSLDSEVLSNWKLHPTNSFVNDASYDAMKLDARLIKSFQFIIITVVALSFK